MATVGYGGGGGGGRMKIFGYVVCEWRLQHIYNCMFCFLTDSRYLKNFGTKIPNF